MKALEDFVNQKVETRESDLPRCTDNQKQFQDFVYPHPHDLSFDHYMIGVAYCTMYPDSYQFVFSDNYVTRADDQAIDEKAWIIKKIDKNESIGKIKIMFDKSDSRLMGIKLYDDAGKRELLSVGPINLKNYRENNNIRT